jgi:hypothetical protein
VLAVLLAVAGPAPAQAPAAAVVEAAGDAVVFSGRISAGSTAQFLRLLQEPAVKRLVITSQGGNVAAALDMAGAIHERGLDVEVPTACLSSCANYIFPAGRRKTIGSPDAVGWHGNMRHVLYLQESGQASWTPGEIDSARQLARREADFYRRLGVDGFIAWFGKLPPYNVDAFYSLSVLDMERFGITQVTRRDVQGAAPRNAEVSSVVVDWAGLEAIRPLVRLDP